MFNQRLREVRLEKNLRQKDLADALGLTLRAICNYEAGTREPSLQILVKLCKYLDVPSDYLLGITDGY